MIKTTDVTPVKVQAFCDQSNCNGEMRPTGTCLTTMPPIYPHQCDKCGAIESFKRTYPFIDYRAGGQTEKNED
jgi:hypothetical protein